MRREYLLFLFVCAVAFLTVREDITSLVLTVTAVFLTFYLKFKVKDIGLVVVSGALLFLRPASLPDVFSYGLFLVILFDLWIGTRQFVMPALMLQAVFVSQRFEPAVSLVWVFLVTAFLNIFLARQSSKETTLSAVFFSFLLTELYWLLAVSPLDQFSADIAFALAYLIVAKRYFLPVA